MLVISGKSPLDGFISPGQFSALTQEVLNTSDALRKLSSILCPISKDDVAYYRVHDIQVIVDDRF